MRLFHLCLALFLFSACSGKSKADIAAEKVHEAPVSETPDVTKDEAVESSDERMTRENIDLRLEGSPTESEDAWIEETAANERPDTTRAEKESRTISCRKKLDCAGLPELENDRSEWTCYRNTCNRFPSVEAKKNYRCRTTSQCRKRRLYHRPKMKGEWHCREKWCVFERTSRKKSK